MATTGLWLIGARGSVATTAVIGMLAVGRGLVPTTGLVTGLPEFQSLPLVAWDQVLVGGHEIRPGSLVEEAFSLADGSRAFDRRLVEALAEELAAVEPHIVPGTAQGSGNLIGSMGRPGFCIPAATPREAIDTVRGDIEAFRQRHHLQRVIVINVASTEPPVDTARFPATWQALADRLDDAAMVLPASTLYAIGAFEAGCPYVNFTPSTGASLPALADLARARNVCFAGRDGKTGETLLKSVLAPMFAARNLEILSWVGHNILGNRDGRVLDDPANKSSKLASKDRLLGQILGYSPQTHVSIELIRSLGDWKTAWDHVHFAGFLGTPMTLQLTWQGCDSVLAAPLVLDLFRLVDLASRRGETGPLGWLAAFFKSPEASEDHDFSRQMNRLFAWARNCAAPIEGGVNAPVASGSGTGCGAAS